MFTFSQKNNLGKERRQLVINAGELLLALLRATAEGFQDVEDEKFCDTMNSLKNEMSRWTFGDYPDA